MPTIRFTNYILDAFFLQNIDDVLNRGFVLSEMERKSEDLTEAARKYRFDQQ